MDDRPRRADARRNYERVLAAAKEVFCELGVTAPLDEIARRAGVGNATMYRHFPTRRELVIAVYADEVTTLCELGRSLRAGSSPADALFCWLRAFITHVATKRELPLAIPDDSTGQRSALYRQWHDTMRTTASGLLGRAQDAGAIRSDLDVTDLLASASGIGHAAADDDQIDRLLTIVRVGVTSGRTPDLRRARASPGSGRVFLYQGTDARECCGHVPPRLVADRAVSPNDHRPIRGRSPRVGHRQQHLRDFLAPL
jgi:AcrR family transcriptional regulator